MSFRRINITVAITDNNARTYKSRPDSYDGGIGGTCKDNRKKVNVR